MPAITLQFQLTRSDLVEASRAISRRRNAATPLYYAGTITTAIGLAFFLHSHNADPDTIDLAALTLIAAGLFMGIQPIWSTHTLFERSVTEADRAIHPATVTIEETGIAYSDTMVTIHCRWNAFLHWHETRNLLVLQRIAHASGLVLPKNSIPTSPLLNDTRTLFNANIGQSRGFPVLRNR